MEIYLHHLLSFLTPSERSQAPFLPPLISYSSNLYACVREGKKG
ncbi:MAG: hypothetical protein MRERV_53c007 [Mycoplasmataceae bacterium RV_VA103A]|nr:MAG: hypothetical protein MRERV_53c007 [Mycoplasmataceae bacterium RV_VA103A]